MPDMQGRLLEWNQAALMMHGGSDTRPGSSGFIDLGAQFQLSTLEGRVLTIDEWPISRILRGEPQIIFDRVTPASLGIDFPLVTLLTKYLTLLL